MNNNEKNSWLSKLTINLENYNKYNIINIDSRCYESYPCFHNVKVIFDNEEHEVLMRGDKIGSYQKYHGQMSLHFMNYICNDRN